MQFIFALFVAIILAITKSFCQDISFQVRDTLEPSLVLNSKANGNSSPQQDPAGAPGLMIARLTDDSERAESLDSPLAHDQFSQDQSPDAANDVISMASPVTYNNDAPIQGFFGPLDDGSLELPSSRLMSANSVQFGSQPIPSTHSDYGPDGVNGQSDPASSNDGVGDISTSTIAAGTHGSEIDSGVLCASLPYGTEPAEEEGSTCRNPAQGQAGSVVSPPRSGTGQSARRRKKKPMEEATFPKDCPSGTYAFCCLGQPVYVPHRRRRAVQDDYIYQDVHDCRYCKWFQLSSRIPESQEICN